jgi:hypothetical protein
MPGNTGDRRSPDERRRQVAAAPERVRWPRLDGVPHPRLRSLLSRGYVGFTEATIPRHLVLPATTAVPLVVKLADSPYRPPAFVMGGHGTSIVLEGDCAPSYLEVLLAPLGAYRLLGLPLDQLSGHTVDLVEVLGADGRRLAEQLRDTPSYAGDPARQGSTPMPCPKPMTCWPGCSGSPRPPGRSWRSTGLG